VSLRLHRQSLSTFREIGDRLAVADSLALIVVNLSAIGDAERAAHLFGAVEAMFETIGNQPAPSEWILVRCEAAVANMGGVLGRERFVKAKTAGHTMTLNQATEYALAS